MKIFNSLTKCKEEFVPITPGVIKMYVCGQTVYDYCHLGHARKAVVFDMIRRWFIASNYQVTFVENITDIDDKIIKRAEENNEDIYALTARFINYMHEDFDRLGIMRPNFQPRATEYIPQMLTIIEGLVKTGYAYQAENGDVYYAVNQFANYGKLSGKWLGGLNAGERVDVDIYKRNPLDFVLWKSSHHKSNIASSAATAVAANINRNAADNAPSWDSAFGPGRPGWHIECSAMACALLGKNFDIHGGGQDLQFPHHENEIAQSEAYHHCQFANYWLHNGFLNINEEKMSKSLGNFFTLREILQQYDAEVLRLFMLKTHYRGQLNFSFAAVDEAKAGLTRLYLTIKNAQAKANSHDTGSNNNNSLRIAEYFKQRFQQAMNDDFNTPLAISILFALCNTINTRVNPQSVKILQQLAGSIGLLKRNADEFLQTANAPSTDTLTVEQIEQLIAKRNQARANKDFHLADSIREKLLQAHIILEDDANKNTTWRRS